MQNDIFQKIENAKTPDFSDILSQSFDLFKKYFKEGIIHGLISIAVALPLLLLVYIPIIPVYIEALQNAGDPYYTPSFVNEFGFIYMIVWFILVFVLSFAVQLVNMSVFGKFLKFLKKEDLGINEDEGGYFTILQAHWKKMLVLTLASMGIAVGAALLCYLPIFYVIVPLHWLFPIFIFNDKLSVSEIIKAAFKIGNKYWLHFVGIGIVVSLVTSVGMIACYIGIIATMPFTYVATYVGYKEVIGFDESPEITN